MATSHRVLDYKSYIGGADNVVSLALFPREQRVYTYSFGQDVSGYTFTGDYQSLVFDSLTYNREDGSPNFTETNVIGYINNMASTPAPVVVDAFAGTVTFTIPENRYTGPIYPSARENVVGTVVTFEWNTPTGEKYAHRYLILETWEAGVPLGSPVSDVNFVSLVV